MWCFIGRTLARERVGKYLTMLDFRYKKTDFDVGFSPYYRDGTSGQTRTGTLIRRLILNQLCLPISPHWHNFRLSKTLQIFARLLRVNYFKLTFDNNSLVNLMSLIQ